MRSLPRTSPCFDKQGQCYNESRQRLLRRMSGPLHTVQWPLHIYSATPGSNRLRDILQRHADEDSAPALTARVLHHIFQDVKVSALSTELALTRKDRG